MRTINIGGSNWEMILLLKKRLKKLLKLRKLLLIKRFWLKIFKKFKKKLLKADFTIKQFIVTVEAGMKDFTRPMILLESAMLGSAKNWSTQLIAVF